jgi:hydroxypyruvate reductase
VTLLFKNSEEALAKGAYERDSKALLEVMSSTLRGADAYAAVHHAVRRDGNRIRIGNRFLRADKVKEIAFVAAGNAAAPMASAFEDVLGKLVTQGILISPEEPPKELPFIRKEVKDPLLPSPEGAEAAAQALELAGGLSSGDLLVPLISPGALGMLALPPDELGLDQYRSLISAAVYNGASTADLTAIARGLSKTQGGRLAEAARGAAVEALVIERGDGGDVVGAGPATPRPRDNGQAARHALEGIGWWGKLPKSLQDKVLAPPPPLSSYSKRPMTVVAAGPVDSLEMAGAEAAAYHHRPKLVELHDVSKPAQAVKRLMDALDVESRLKGDPKDRGIALFAGLSLGVPEGGEEGRHLKDFLVEAHDSINRRGTTVAIVYTGGSLRPTVSPSSGMTDSMTPPVYMDLKEGFTDVGTIAIVWWSPEEERSKEGDSPPKAAQRGK